MVNYFVTVRVTSTTAKLLDRIVSKAGITPNPDGYTVMLAYIINSQRLLTLRDNMQEEIVAKIERLMVIPTRKGRQLLAIIDGRPGPYKADVLFNRNTEILLDMRGVTGCPMSTKYIILGTLSEEAVVVDIKLLDKFMGMRVTFTDQETLHMDTPSM